MKKLIFLPVLLLTLAAESRAQESNRTPEGAIVRGPYETNRLLDNVVVGAAGGVNLYSGETDFDGSAARRLAPALDLWIGKWVTPSVGVRLVWSGLKAKGWTDRNTPYAMSGKGLREEKFGVSFLHADVMWNFSNAVGGYKQRLWSFVPFAGAGWARSWGNGSSCNEVAATAGLLNIVRLCPRLDLTLEGRFMLVNQRFDGVAGGSRPEGMTSVTLGLAFKIGRYGFRRAVNEKPYRHRIDALVKERSDLAARILELAERNEALQAAAQQASVREDVTREVTVPVPTPVALFFRIGRSTLERKELVNLDFYVENALKTDPDKTFTLVGGADKATGTEAVNQRLSEERARYVFDLLTERYGIPAQRLRWVADGDRNNRFPEEPELNRTVLILE